MKLFNEDRVKATAAFIAAELRTLLDQKTFQACPTFKDGLTIGESMLATLRALAVLQLEISDDLASWMPAIRHYNPWEDDEPEFDKKAESKSKFKLCSVTSDEELLRRRLDANASNNNN